MDVSWMKCWWLQKNCIKLTILLFHLKYPLLTELKTERKWESVCASSVFCTTIKTLLVFISRMFAFSEIHLSSSTFPSHPFPFLSYLSCGIFHEHWIYVNVFMHATFLPYLPPPWLDWIWRGFDRMMMEKIFHTAVSFAKCGSKQQLDSEC